MTDIAKTAKGLIRPATPDEIAREDSKYVISSDSGLVLVTDDYQVFVPNTPDFGYTNPNLHRRLDPDAVAPEGSDYKFVHYDKDGRPYKQKVTIGVWDGVHSYRTTTTYTHDEESTTSEIP